MNIHQKWLKRFRFLTQALIISGALNIGLIATFFYFVLKDRQRSIVYELKPSSGEKTGQELTLAEALMQFSTLSFRELASYLAIKDHIEDGYTYRDIALACLVKYHHFNISSALPGQMLQKRTLIFSKKDSPIKTNMFIFAGLSDYHFDAICHYAYTEKWPLTPEGLFLLLQKWKKPWDDTLKQTFFVTEEFHLIRTLFHRSNVSIEPDLLLKMLCEGDWAMLEDFVNKQRKESDLSETTRRIVLLNYIYKKSPSAASILLQCDFLFGVKRLDDKTICLILDLLSKKTEDVEQFCFELIKSSRADEVWKKSAQLLYRFEGEELKEPYDHKETLKRFVLSKVLQEKWGEKEKELKPLAEVVFGKKSNVISYTVEDGDTLWKIARRYKIDIDELIEYNHLKTDCIYPGSQLNIPREE